MFSGALSRGVSQILFRQNQSGAKCIAVAMLHTSAPSSNVLGEIIQRIRFRYYHDPRHHLDYDKWAKIFCVEGNVKSGKGALAEEFAKRKNLRFFPSADYTYLITAPEREHHSEEVEFLMDEEHLFKKAINGSLAKIYTNPEDWAQMARYHRAVMRARFHQYADAFVHLIGTGQGVVIERGFFSLPVFEYAFKKMKWQNQEVLDYFLTYRLFMAQDLMPPQVVLYLNSSPEECMENIKKNGTDVDRSIPMEYLRAMDEGYSMYLQEADKRGTKVISFDSDMTKDMDEVMMVLDEEPSLLHEYSHWGGVKNGRLKKLMRDFSDDFMLHKISSMYPPINEIAPPQWTFYAYPEYEDSRHWWRQGYDPKETKWLWLKEPSPKKHGYLF